MIRIFEGTVAVVVAICLSCSAAMATCEDDCNNGFNVCMRNCGGQAGCLETCSRGRAGCLRRCNSGTMNFMPRPLLVQGRTCPGATPYYCGSGSCCEKPSRYACVGYTGTLAPPGDYCGNSTAPETLAHLRSNCAEFVFCTGQ